VYGGGRFSRHADYGAVDNASGTARTAGTFFWRRTKPQGKWKMKEKEAERDLGRGRKGPPLRAPVGRHPGVGGVRRS